MCIRDRGWTCPPHFCQRSFLRLMQIRWVFIREEGVGGPWVGHGLELPYVKFKVIETEFAYKCGRVTIVWRKYSTLDSNCLGHILHIAEVLEGISVDCVHYDLFTFFLFSATSHITSTAIPNCFSVDIGLQYCTCHPGRYLQFFLTRITITWGSGSWQNTENEANLRLPLGTKS